MRRLCLWRPRAHPIGRAHGQADGSMDPSTCPAARATPSRCSLPTAHCLCGWLGPGARFTRTPTECTGESSAHGRHGGAKHDRVLHRHPPAQPTVVWARRRCAFSVWSGSCDVKSVGAMSGQCIVFAILLDRGRHVGGDAVEYSHTRRVGWQHACCSAPHQERRVCGRQQRR